MKITIIYAAFVAALSVEAFAVAGQDECFADGGPCSALKRAVEAVARYSLHDRQSHHHHQCWTDGAMCFKEKREVCGSSCLKAKRDALALTKAVAEAAPFTNLDRQQCNSKEGHCSKAKRNAAEAAEALAAAEAHHDSSARDGEYLLPIQKVTSVNAVICRCRNQRSNCSASSKSSCRSPSSELGPSSMLGCRCYVFQSQASSGWIQ